ncbi:A/G-specific adenine glycosylase [Virgibacillus natechei]|uniref:Adenine DNA glycosylase n=1 Tax=Virgibacillus natechei TaxID=1216297 RepID=A0ABS4IJG8_9BACI|nr:A/G-specific adenine glycosylase [Virgibacillus natechei]MBP1970586.1 A/G-specific adenine glycosylase [Virgibacillus natechei]UZD14017.1 A/G-specific adenine glycosylase [Virgibacillus natechei]
MTYKNLQNFNKLAFQQRLLDWYQANKRDLPWRKDQNPYKVWVSEIMLQQTKVDTVIPYFYRFIEKFPTVYKLADAEPEDVLKAWEGLGYYSRARNLQNAVREVVATYGGEIPSDPAELGSLKGVGPYTKGAILSIAFDQAEPAVDGNVMRVLSRILKIEEDIAKARTKKLFESYVRELISEQDPSSFNQAVMELGALICTPKSPACPRCPVREHCLAFSEGIEQELPIKTKAKKQKTIPYVTLLIKNEKSEYIIEKRANKGLLADLWQFPMVPINEIGWDHLENWIYNEYGLDIKISEKKGELKHTFSHLIWELEIYTAMTSHQQTDDERLCFVEPEGLQAYPFPVSHQKMMQYIEE